MKKFNISTVVFLATIFLLSCSKSDGAAEDFVPQEDGLYAQFQTNKGSFTARLAFEEAPMTVMNFVGLTEGTLEHNLGSGNPFYDGLTFHRVEPGFVIQGGDPQGDGRGGPGYQFPDEFSPQLRHSKKGILSMANAGPRTNGSQFFITLSETQWLDDRHSVFGEVIGGLNTLDQIQAGDTMESVKILRIGTKAEAFVARQEAFEALVELATEALRPENVMAKLYPNAVEGPQGLRYIIENPGTGSTLKEGQKITLHYEGRVLGGPVFDSSWERNEPLSFTFSAGQFVPGFQTTLLEMRSSERRIAILPPELAYGEQGIPGVIPPSSHLVFTIEILSVEE